MAQGTLNPGRRGRLEIIGFDWDPISSRWERMFGDLVRYKEVHGHCRVTAVWPESQRLANWIAVQRTAKHKGKLTAERIARLERIGFDWDPHATHWEAMLADLDQFQEKYGHCRVPQEWPEKPQLARWVAKQRVARGQGKLAAERIARLERIGFDWNPHATHWEAMLAELGRFQKEYGHCQVPQRWPEKPQLARWVARQRMAREQGKLSAERIKRLKKLGLAFVVKS